jgi:hypothetical protein
LIQKELERCKSFQSVRDSQVWFTRQSAYDSPGGGSGSCACSWSCGIGASGRVATRASSAEDVRSLGAESSCERKQFARGLVPESGFELYLTDGYGKDALSRPIPSDSLSIVRAARSGHPAQIGLAVRASYTTAAINSPAQVIPRTHAADRTLPKSSAKIFPPWMQSVLLNPVPNRPT